VYRYLWRPALLLALIHIFAISALCSIFGSIRTIVHDPQHRPVKGATIQVQSRSSDWSVTASTDENGAADILNVPIGEYTVTVTATGFQPQEQMITIQSSAARDMHFALQIQTVEQNVQVSAEPEQVDPTSSTAQTLISRTAIRETPGADRTSSLAMITNYVPSATIVHDQLHVRGGHQVTWAIDGVPVPNTNIASNVGPQFDPKDIDYVEVQRGGLGAEYGDRTYGVFNVITRSGFERQREGEVVLSYGSFNSTDNQISFGDHSEKAAYYFSVNGNRTDHALETPTFETLHDQGAGGGAFTSLIFNPRPSDQFRLVGAVRADHFQVPNDPDQQAAGVRDRDREQDAFLNFTYLHNIGSSMVLTVAPFFHFNRAAFEGGPLDVPSATDNRASTYAGGQVSLGLIRGKHNAKFGFYAFGQHDNTLFALAANDGSGEGFRQRQIESGDIEAGFIEEQYKATEWLTFNAGLRLTRFSGSITETAASPRLGAAIQILPLRWVLRGSYSRTYQPPPLSTLGGPLIELALQERVGFLPLRGERDEQHDVGLTIPVKGWVADLDYFRTGARNFFDHDALGNSNIFFPLTIDHVRIRGFEASLRSPRLYQHADLHLAYSYQKIQGSGAVSGGLTEFEPPEEGLFFLDHDQRHTLSLGFRTDLPWRSWVAASFAYGSGFLKEDGPEHLPSYQTVDLSAGKSLGENWSVKVTATNLLNKRYFIDLSNTFGGSHTGDPRMIMGQIRYRFHY
jgi:outer membrane receptor protein involved in Fe transport